MTRPERIDDAHHDSAPDRSPGGIIISPLLSASGFRLAFFSRLGGVSQAPFESLNFSATVGDAESAVSENLFRAGQYLQVEPDRILFLNQVHGTACHPVSCSNEAAIVRHSPGDCVLSCDSLVACAVRVADCAPILIADRATGWVAAVHSGWRGTLLNIAAAAVRALRVSSGVDGDLLAAVGPHIESCCFEVGREVANDLIAASPDKDIVRPGRGDRLLIDLRRMIHAQLIEAGVAEVDHVRGCTHCEPSLFFSFRRDGNASGRHLAAIVAR